MKLRSVRVRLALWNVGILALLLLLVLVTIHLTVRNYMLTAIDHRLTDMADRFALRLPAPPRPERRSPRDPAENDPGRRRNARLFRVFDQSGHLMSPEWEIAPQQEAPWDRAAYQLAVAGQSSLSTAPSPEAQMRVYSRPLTRRNRQIGVIQLAFPLTELFVLQEGLTRMLLLITPFALLAAGIGGLVLTDRALRPVREIAHTADAVNAADLSHRLTVTGNDEFAHLAMTINRMLARLENAFTRLEQAIEQERRFTSDASHELRTPLTAVKANTSLALRGERTPDQYRAALRAADKAADVMTRLVDDLLLLARSDSEQIAPTCQSVDPANLFSEAIALQVNGTPHAPVRVDIADPSLRLWGDAHQLLRLISNLLCNALRYTPEDGRVMLSAVRQADHAVITVADTGEGIAAEHLAHLGERFYRIDPARARSQGGLGLGLSICKSLVAAHHGTIAFDSAPGEGTRVTITLPMAKEES